MRLDYSVVIATYQRPSALETALASLAAQTKPPAMVVVIDGDPALSAEAIAAPWAARLSLIYRKAHQPSAAVQRNQGMEFVDSPLVAFMDDDAEVPGSYFDQLCSVFEGDTARAIGGVSGRLEGMTHPKPRGLLWWYYRFQAGYPHPTYGGKLFGAAVNCLPCYEEEEGPLIASDWLGSTCVLYRTELAQKEKFPEFAGYSFLEDAHLSARIGKTHQLYFHRDAVFQHHDETSSFKRNYREMARHRVRNQRVVARDVLNLSPWQLTIKLLISRLFSTAVILRQRSAGWLESLVGTWT